MAFTIYYRSLEAVDDARAKKIEQDAALLCQGRSWLSCEPVSFFSSDDGHLLGGSKPNFMPDPEDASEAAASGLPDGTPMDMLQILSKLSIDNQVTWEIDHDESEGPIGLIREGTCDPEVVERVETLSNLGDMFG